MPRKRGWGVERRWERDPSSPASTHYTPATELEFCKPKSEANSSHVQACHVYLTLPRPHSGRKPVHWATHFLQACYVYCQDFHSSIENRWHNAWFEIYDGKREKYHDLLHILQDFKKVTKTHIFLTLFIIWKKYYKGEIEVGFLEVFIFSAFSNFCHP